MSNTLLQPAAFLAMLYGGAVIGMVYDILRFLRIVCKARIAQVICDGVFALLATLMTACTLLYASGGAIRPYLAAGLAAGFIIEQWSFSYLVYHLFYAIRARL